jgi:hypothetical protein
MIVFGVKEGIPEVPGFHHDIQARGVSRMEGNCDSKYCQ